MRYSNSPFEAVSGFFRRHKALRTSLSLIALLIALAICWGAGAAYEAADAPEQYIPIPETEEDLEKNFSYLTVTDRDMETGSDSWTAIDLSSHSGTVEITSGGDYLLSGKLTGCIHIIAKEQKVHLCLNNVNIASKAGPAIYCEEADKFVITVLDGTENTISDSGDYRNIEDAEACIYSECDMTVNGTGSLAVNGYYKDAIRSKDILKILGGTYAIKCKRTGLHGNDGVVITAGDITISSEKNGVKTTKNGVDGRGNLMISGGELFIIAGRYAFVTTKADIYIYDCVVHNRSIVSTYDCGGVKYVQEGCVQ